MENRSLLAAVAGDLRRSWKDLVLTDLAYKLIAFVVLTPAIGILFRVLIAASGNSILTDQDILFFFLGPIGWICFVVVGAVAWDHRLRAGGTFGNRGRGSSAEANGCGAGVAICRGQPSLRRLGRGTTARLRTIAHCAVLARSMASLRPASHRI